MKMMQASLLLFCSSLLLFCCNIYFVAFSSEAVSQSDSTINTACDHQRYVCQINVSPDRFMVENARMKQTIRLLQEEIRKLKADEDTSHENPFIMLDGARWRAFWWYKKSSGWPKYANDVLQDEYGSCDPNTSYCFGRLPKQLSEAGAEMLGIDSAGTIYRWSFDALNPTAHAVWNAFHDHKQTPAGSVLNSHAWHPKVIAGSNRVDGGPKQDSFMYRMEHGVTSLLLDDDNCYCSASLSLGHGMCKAGFSTRHGPENIFGVYLFSYSGCQPSPDNGLTLFFRDDDNCVGVDCGPGLKCVDDIDTYRCVY